jgi:hypothetical protein
MCVLDYIKNKSKYNLDYKSSFEMIVELLICENNFDVLSEYIISYEENKEDDTLLYNIFSTIASFEKNYILYNDEERNQFWDCMEKLLTGANFSKIQIARFLLFLIETKEDKFFIKEQFTLIIKCYQYFMQHMEIAYKSSDSHIGNNNHLNNSIKKGRDDRLSKFMRSVIGFEADKNKNLSEDDILDDIKNKIFIIVFSNCDLEKLKVLFKEKNYFSLEYIIEINEQIKQELREESPAINFCVISNNFWKKANGVYLKNNANVDENLTANTEMNSIDGYSLNIDRSKNSNESYEMKYKSSHEFNNNNNNNLNNQAAINSMNKNPYVHISSVAYNNLNTNKNNVNKNDSEILVNNSNIVSDNISHSNSNDNASSTQISHANKKPHIINNNINNGLNEIANNKNTRNSNVSNQKEANENTTSLSNLHLNSFNDSFKKACLNLINLNQLEICLSLSKFYKLSNDELEKFDNFMKFVIKNFEELKKIPYNDLNTILNKAFTKSLESVTHFIKTLHYDVKEILIEHLNNCLNFKSLENIMLLTLLKILISVGINLDINEFLNFDEKIEFILYRLIDSNLDSKNIFNHLNKLFDNDELLAKTIIEKFIFYRRKSNFSSQAEVQKYKLFRYVKYFKSPFKFGMVIKNNLNEALLKIRNIKDFNDFFLELLILGYYSFLKDCFHHELGEFNQILKNCIDQNEFFLNMSNLFNICEDDERVKEIFYCINHNIFKNDFEIFNENKNNLNVSSEIKNDFPSLLNIQIQEFREKAKNCLVLNHRKNSIRNQIQPSNFAGNAYNNYGIFKAEIEFYNRIKNFKKLGNIYVKLANEYAKLVEERTPIESKLKKTKKIDCEIIRKEQDLTIINLYLRAAQQFLLDNCIVNYSKVFNKINELIEKNFSDDIDINLD